jgi:DNA-binding beta-propeller fold protein YncE
MKSLRALARPLTFAVALTATLGLAAEAHAEPALPGHVYVTTNAPGGNGVLSFEYRKNGAVTPVEVAEYRTGGTGARQVPGPNVGVFDADQQIALNAKRTLMFAVNRGSNSITVFKVGEDGVLTRVKGSPFASGGETPVSIGVSGKHLVVVNASNRMDATTTLPPRYRTFLIRKGGRLKLLPGGFTAPMHAQPEIAQMSPNGKLVFGAEFSSQFIRSFTLGGSGALRQAPGSPLKFDPSVTQGINDGRPVPDFLRPTPLGMAVHPKKRFVYVDAPLANRIVTYSYATNGKMTFRGFVENPGAFTPCWNRITADGKFMYVTNTNTGNITVFSLANPAVPRQIQVRGTRGGGGPTEFEIDPTGHFLFAVVGHNDADSPDLLPTADGNELHVFRIAGSGRITELGSSPAFLPLPFSAKPEGVVVIPAAELPH